MDETFTLNVCLNRSMWSISCWAAEHGAGDCTVQRIPWPNCRVSRFSTFLEDNGERSRHSHSYKLFRHRV